MTKSVEQEIDRLHVMNVRMAKNWADMAQRDRELINELAIELGAYHRNYQLVSEKIDKLLSRAWNRVL